VRLTWLHSRAVSAPSEEKALNTPNVKPRKASRVIKHISTPLLLAASLAALSGCTSPSQLAKCPPASVLVDTATIAVRQDAGAAADPANLLYSVQIASAKADCSLPKYDKEVESSVDINFRAERSRPGDAASYKVPYFVAITTEGKVLAKRIFTVNFGFAAGETVSSFSDSVASLTLTVGRDKRPGDYGILVGFQLTKEQLEYNRHVGRYAP
jgi:hypothetical protein